MQNVLLNSERYLLDMRYAIYSNSETFLFLLKQANFDLTTMFYSFVTAVVSRQLCAICQDCLTVSGGRYD